MGSAYGGEWKPKKPDDERFIGKPGEIKTTKDKMEIFDLPKSVKMAKRFQNDIFRITVTHATIPYRTTTN